MKVLDVSLNALEGATMKLSVGAFAALLIIGNMFLQPAHAQSAPEGSYSKSCTDARVEDRTLTAVCRITDGREQRTSLTDVNRCVGDIGNDNGALACSHGQPMAPFREDRR
jgi:CVNH domain